MPDELTVKLFLTRVDETFDPKADVILGPWCLIGSFEKFPSWEKLDFYDPFPSHESITEATENIAVLTSYYVSKLGHNLNQEHGTSYKTEFWWPLLVFWLIQTISASWSRWVQIEQTVTRLKDKIVQTHVLENAELRKWNFEDTQDSILNGLRKPSFDFWINSLILKNLAPDNWQLLPSETDYSLGKNMDQCTVDPVVHWLSPIKSQVRRILGHLAITDVAGLNYFDTLIMSAWLNLFASNKRAAKFYAPAEKAPPDYFPGSFLNVLNVILSATLPKSLSTNFEKYSQTARRLNYKRGRPFIIGSANSNDRQNFEIAHAVASGERVIRTQHGADYGTMANCVNEWMAEYIYSGFITWGWEKHNDRKGNFIPLPSPLLSQHHNKYTGGTDKIIFVGTRILLQLCHIDVLPPPGSVKTYIGNKIKFMSSLNEEHLNRLYYRPYMRSHNDFIDHRIICSHFPEIKIHSGDLIADAMDCDLLVLDHPGTTHNFALAANIPIVCIWESKLYPPAQEAKKYFQTLHDANILFDDPVKAGQHINTLNGNTLNWWNRSDVRLAVAQWREKFALSSTNWRKDWLCKIIKI